MSRTGYSPFWRPPSSTPGSSFSACRIYISADITPAGGLSPIPFDASDIDTDGYADVAFNRIVVPTGFGGTFAVTMRLGVNPQSALTSGRANVFMKTVTSGLRDYEEHGWREMNDLIGHESQFRIIQPALTFADGEVIYADWQDNTSGGGFFIFGGQIGSPGTSPESYLQIVRLGA